MGMGATYLIVALLRIDSKSYPQCSNAVRGTYASSSRGGVHRFIARFECCGASHSIIQKTAANDAFGLSAEDNYWGAANVIVPGTSLANCPDQRSSLAA